MLVLVNYLVTMRYNQLMLTKIAMLLLKIIKKQLSIRTKRLDDIKLRLNNGQEVPRDVLTTFSNEESDNRQKKH
ncbi:MAG: hypothetical protein CM15mL6_170 [uncultured marine virus]|nr:MAG: hypothetical protein CM15mL6_170 [uncultured marine virus]